MMPAAEVLDSREGSPVAPERDTDKLAGADVVALVVFVVVMIVAGCAIAIPMALELLPSMLR